MKYTILSSVLLAAPAWAHFVLQSPPPIGPFDEDKEDKGPCGGYELTARPDGKITSWPVNGQPVSLMTTHPSQTWVFRYYITGDQNMAGMNMSGMSGMSGMAGMDMGKKRQATPPANPPTKPGNNTPAAAPSGAGGMSGMPGMSMPGSSGSGTGSSGGAAVPPLPMPMPMPSSGASSSGSGSGMPMPMPGTGSGSSSSGSGSGMPMPMPSSPAGSGSGSGMPMPMPGSGSSSSGGGMPMGGPMSPTMKGMLMDLQANISQTGLGNSCYVLRAPSPKLAGLNGVVQIINAGKSEVLYQCVPVMFTAGPAAPVPAICVNDTAVKAEMMPIAPGSTLLGGMGESGSGGGMSGGGMSGGGMSGGGMSGGKTNGTSPTKGEGGRADVPVTMAVLGVGALVARMLM